MATAKDNIPTTISLWKESFSTTKMADNSMHTIRGISSASDILYGQFLALQVIWTEAGSDSKLRTLADSDSDELA